MRVIDFLASDCIIATLQAKNKPAVLTELSGHLAKVVPGVEAEALRRCWKSANSSRRRRSATASPSRTASSTPSGAWSGALGRAVDGIEFESIDGKPTNLVFMLVAPASSTGVHLKALARLSRLFRDGRLPQAPARRALRRGDVSGHRRGGREVLDRRLDS